MTESSNIFQAVILKFLTGAAHIKFYKCTPTATQHALYANFNYVQGKGDFAW